MSAAEALLTPERLARLDQINARKQAAVGAAFDLEEIQPTPARADRKPVMDTAAFHGLAGDVVRAIHPTTEADPVAVLATFLTAFGGAVGRGPHMMIGESRHGANLFIALVGETSRGRKGDSSRAVINRVMYEADRDWTLDRVMGGLSSGEGMIHTIRDEVLNASGGVTGDGVDDKRALFIEEELSQVLKAAQRQGATISEIIRRAWDSPAVLRTLTKANPSKASDPHISIIGHITKAELARLIRETELANGFANRFAWFRVHRERLIADPQPMPFETVQELGRRTRAALEYSRSVGRIARDAEAADMWQTAYSGLEHDRPGLSGAITARSSPIVCRLSLIYALMDYSPVIRVDHLEAAVAVWDYAQASVESIFGDLTGDDVSDRILDALRTEGEQTRTQLYDAFGRNVPSARIGHSLTLLHEGGKITVWKQKSQPGGGRPSTIYRLVEREAAS
ncbi:MAG: DUF3987 domain-containing protein [Chloroflexia bacterium]|nr:DUF3987 domain-containing protein [Chloroflexia bacterium]